MLDYIISASHPSFRPPLWRPYSRLLFLFRSPESQTSATVHLAQFGSYLNTFNFNVFDLPDACEIHVR